MAIAFPYGLATHAARIMEYALLPESAGVKNDYINKKTAYEKLQEAYKSAEEYIGKEIYLA